MKAQKIIPILIWLVLSQVTNVVPLFVTLTEASSPQENSLQSSSAETAYLNGLKLFRQEKYKAAIDKFKTALTVAPDDPQIWNHMGTCYYQLGAYEEALGKFTRATELDPNNVEFLMNLTLTLSKLNRYNEAEKQILKILRLDPQNVSALSLLGLIYFQTERLDKALVAYNKALSLSPKDARITYLTGNIYYKKNDIPQAAAFYEKALRLNNKLRKAAYNLGNCYYKLKQSNKAIEYYQKGLHEIIKKLKHGKKVEPEHARAFYNLGTLFYEKKDYGKAESAFDYALKVDTQFNAARWKRGLLFYDTQRYDLAIKEFEFCAKQKVSPLVYRDLAKSYFKIKNHGKAALSFENYITQARSVPVNDLIFGGRLHTILKDWEKSKHFFQQAVLSDSRNIVALKGYASAMLALGEFAEAIPVLESIFAHLSSENNQVRTVVCYNLGVSYERTGDLATARDWYLKSTENTPNALLYYLAANTSYKLKDLSRARSLLSQTLRFKWRPVSGNGRTTPPPEYYTLFANVLLKKREYDLLFKICRKSVQAFPNNSTLLNNYAIALFYKGKYEKASQILNMAMEHDHRTPAVLLNHLIMNYISQNSKRRSTNTSLITELNTLLRLQKRGQLPMESPELSEQLLLLLLRLKQNKKIVHLLFEEPQKLDNAKTMLIGVAALLKIGQFRKANQLFTTIRLSELDSEREYLKFYHEVERLIKALAASNAFIEGDYRLAYDINDSLIKSFPSDHNALANRLLLSAKLQLGGAETMHLQELLSKDSKVYLTCIYNLALEALKNNNTKKAEELLASLPNRESKLVQFAPIYLIRALILTKTEPHQFEKIAQLLKKYIELDGEQKPLILSILQNIARICGEKVQS